MKPRPSNASRYRRTPGFSEAKMFQPRVPHELEPLDPIRFFVEFLRVGEASAG